MVLTPITERPGAVDNCYLHICFVTNIVVCLFTSSMDILAVLRVLINFFITLHSLHQVCSLEDNFLKLIGANSNSEDGMLYSALCLGTF